MVLPALSGRLPPAARRRRSPVPPGMPRCGPARAVSIAVALLILTISSITDRSRMSGWIGADAGSCAANAVRRQHRTFLGLDRDDPARLARLQHLPTPVMVPPVRPRTSSHCRRCRSRFPPPWCGGEFQDWRFLELLRHRGVRHGAHQFLGGRSSPSCPCRRHQRSRRRGTPASCGARRHRFRHHQLQPVAARRRDEGQCRYCRGRFDRSRVGVDAALIACHRRPMRSFTLATD